MKVNYTKDQLTAITAKGQNIIVSAGAGSGKTQVLTARVVHFIKNEGYHLDQFLILTFTNLAAAEMKERIRKALKEEKLPDYHQVDTALISTFDSYALSLVKKYHLLLKISENISIIDSNLMEVRKRSILNEIFEQYYEQNDLIFCQMIDKFCFKDDLELKNLVLKIYAKAILANNTNEYLDQFVTKYYSDDLINHIIVDLYMYLKSLCSELADLVKQLPSVALTKKDSRILKDVAEKLFSSSFNAENYDDLVGNFPLVLGFNSPRTLTETDKEHYKEFKDYHNYLLKLIQELPKNQNQIKTEILSNREYAQKIIEIIRILDEKINIYKAHYQVYEFSDIAKMALKLVKENEEVKENIKNQLKMIMIDEYQDTSALQEAFINEIEMNNVYMVGDVKQSIYRFRNARCDIFVDKYEQYKYHNQGLAIDLKKNFRSRKEVLDDINYIFKNIMTKEYGGASYREDHLIEFGNKAYLKAQPIDIKHSEFLTYNLDEQGPEQEATLIAKDIITKINTKYQVMGKDDDGSVTLRPCTYSDFCILMDRGTNFDIYAKIFNEYQLPLYIENDENIASTQIVLVLINLLKVIKGIITKANFSTYKVAYISIARSFLYNKTDEEIYNIISNKTYYETDIFKEINQILYETKAYPFVMQFEQLIFRLDFYHKCIKLGNVTKNEKYLDTILNLFTTLSHLDYNVDDLIDYLEKIDEYKLKITLSSSGSNLNSIKLMNIHKSKGLEFNIVYYSGLLANFNQIELKENFNISNHYGLILPLDDGKKSYIKLLNSILESKEDLSERIRLFYVALTRAKEKMIFVVPDDVTKPKQEMPQIESRYPKIIEDLINAYQNENINQHFALQYLKCLNIFLTNEQFNQLIHKELTLKFDDNRQNFNLQLPYYFTNLEELNMAYRLANPIKTFINEEEITLMQASLGITNHHFDTFITAVSFLGYEVSDLGKKKLPILLSNPTNEEIIDLYSIPFEQYYLPTTKIIEDIIENSTFTGEIFLKKCYVQYQNASINEAKLIDLINVIGFEEDVNFSILSDDDKKSFNRNDVDQLFVEKTYYTLKEGKNFNQFLSPFRNYRKFNTYTYITSEQFKINDSKQDNRTAEKLIVKPLKIINSRKEITKASKKIDITASKKLIDFGTNIHKALEMIDFKNPCYDLITNQYEKTIISQFLSSPLLSNIQNAKIIKEYEFIDVDNQTNGIIDLMLIYDDCIDIIDYKTKNIDDEAYLNQLNIYYEYIKNKSCKPINVYLYSLLSGIVKQVKSRD